ncbi:probable WRKY transcription factor 33 isoform X1 [Lolium rigidum]|uniref:probable WRKY transcription factor 33 isoform X1 n=2 Tax=Lolium rigidum TaxID=89674 RepID=UPI001F5DEA7A|nr:probable WRKY transcription factor 33 isoform X1 [Lolium rigidum]XP_047081447.1 probable WRKY transcription factor 33 isoform X1 [Lolium rigidum]XP_047081449.1 probable WRKY transcription factor 33 isoform X1 [Lolium rigidum]XP_047081450.1 probable WRKY transcription factor 33 isoform X1 [Lolium rigidum]
MSWWDMFFYWMPTVTTGCKKNFAVRGLYHKLLNVTFAMGGGCSTVKQFGSTLSSGSTCPSQSVEAAAWKLDVLAITTSTIGMVAAESRAIREPRVVQKTTKVGIFLILIVGASKVRRMLKEIQIQVGKHVERASYDVNYVIMTKREGHNHEVRAARNSGHVSDGSGSALRGQLESFNFLFRNGRLRSAFPPANAAWPANRLMIWYITS